MKSLLEKLSIFFRGKIRPKSPAEKMCEDLELQIECLQSTIRDLDCRLFKETLKHRALTRMIHTHISRGGHVL